ncbi:hypothetical protein Trydic_g21035 [Trypoxylus dichotomus]
MVIRIKPEMDTVYGGSAPSFAIAKFWATGFNGGRTSLLSEERRDGEKLQSTSEKKSNPNGAKRPVREIIEAVGISRECVCHILTEDLIMKRLGLCWLPRLFSQDQKRTWINTINGASLHYYTPETKALSQ